MPRSRRTGGAALCHEVCMWHEMMDTTAQPDTKSIRLTEAPFPGPANRDVQVDVEPNFGGSAGTAAAPAVQLQMPRPVASARLHALARGASRTFPESVYYFDAVISFRIFTSNGIPCAYLRIGSRKGWRDEASMENHEYRLVLRPKICRSWIELPASQLLITDTTGHQDLDFT